MAGCSGSRDSGSCYEDMGTTRDTVELGTYAKYSVARREMQVLVLTRGIDSIASAL